MRRDQEGRQRQGLRTIFKPLRDGMGKQMNHSERHCGGFHTFGLMKEALRGRRSSSDEEIIGAMQNWLKMQPKKLFSDGIKKELLKRWNGCVEVEGITLKNNISFVSVHNVFFKVPLLFDLPSCIRLRT
jgi:hypothetical protein